MKNKSFTSLFFGAIIVISPFLQFSWDVWSQTIIHLLSALLLVILLIINRNRNIKFNSGYLLLFGAYILFLYFNTRYAKLKFNAELEFNNWINYFIVFACILLIPYEYIRKLLKYVVLAVFAAGFITIYSALFNSPFLQYTLFNNNILSGYLILAFPAVIYFLFKSGTEILSGRKTDYLVKLGIVIIIGAAILLTKSASGICSLLLSFAIVFSGKLKKKWIFLILILCVVSAVAFTDLKSVFDRVSLWMVSLEIIKSNPFGIGLSGFEFIYPKYKAAYLSSMFAHNYYLQMFSETGIIGIVLLCVLLYYGFILITNPYFKAAILSCLIQNLFEYNLYILANGILFWSILSIAVKGREDRDISLKNTGLLYITLIFCAVYTANVITMYSSTRNYISGKQSLEENRLQEAEKYLVKSISLKKEMWLSYDLLATVNLKEYSTGKNISGIYESIDLLETGLKYNPYNYKSLFTAANLYRFAGENKYAEIYLGKAIEANPGKEKEYIELWKRNIFRY